MLLELFSNRRKWNTYSVFTYVIATTYCLIQLSRFSTVYCLLYFFFLQLSNILEHFTKNTFGLADDICSSRLQTIKTIEYLYFRSQVRYSQCNCLKCPDVIILQVRIFCVSGEELMKDFRSTSMCVCSRRDYFSTDSFKTYRLPAIG